MATRVKRRRRVYKSELSKEEVKVDEKHFEEELEAELLPLSNVMSIVRSVIPEKSDFQDRKIKCSKPFQKLLLRCLAEFFHIVAVKLHQTGKRVFTDEDVLQAMESLGINQYATILRLFMSDYRELAFSVQQRGQNHMRQEIAAIRE